MGVRIDALPTTSNPATDHEVPAMKGGLTVRLTLAQIISLVQAANIGGFNEAVDDRIAALLVASGLLVETYDDAGNSLGLSVAVASQAEAEAGSVNDKAVTPLRVAQAIATLSTIRRSFESAEQTITAAGPLTLAHGLGMKPKLVQPLLVCKTAEHGYSINDKVFIAPSGPQDGGTGSNESGVSITPDSTNLNVRYGAMAGTFYVTNKSTGVKAVITAANWRFVLRAWA
jgi:hypothetical protein